MTPATRTIGAHAPTAGGLLPAKSGRSRAKPSTAEYLERVDASAVQVFASNPRGWALPTIGASDRDFAAWAAGAKIPVFVHAPMLINVGSPDPTIVSRSVELLAATRVRAAALGASGVVFHAGSSITADFRAGALAQLKTALVPLLDADGPQLLVEPTAGGGQALAATVAQLAEFVAATDDHDALGVCLDTCHVMAAGHDIGSPAGMRAMLDELAELGAGRLALVHVNDSKDPPGSKRDRHERIGAGTIGLASFGELLRHPVVTRVPLVVETASDLDGVIGAGHGADIATLRGVAGDGDQL